MGKKKGTNGMMKKITKRLWEKKNSKKGFTLVELIVVLVILAILAAIMVPALTGWIDKAKEKQVALEARSAYLAVQTLASVEYGTNNPDRSNITFEDIADLADLDETNTNILITVYYKAGYGENVAISKEAFTVSGLTYTNADIIGEAFTIGTVGSTLSQETYKASTP